MDFNSRVEAAAASISGAVNYLRTAGDYAYGDGGDALYARTTATTPGGFQSADGAWWRIALSGPANILAFGAVPGDTTKAAINQTAFTDAFGASASVLAPVGTFHVQSIAPPSTARRLQLDADLVRVEPIADRWALSRFNPTGLAL